MTQELLWTCPFCETPVAEGDAALYTNGHFCHPECFEKKMSDLSDPATSHKPQATSPSSNIARDGAEGPSKDVSPTSPHEHAPDAAALFLTDNARRAADGEPSVAIGGNSGTPSPAPGGGGEPGFAGVPGISGPYTAHESAVISLIVGAQGREPAATKRPRKKPLTDLDYGWINADEITAKTGLRDREVRYTVHDLRAKGEPIGSRYGVRGGYRWCERAEDLEVLDEQLARTARMIFWSLGARRRSTLLKELLAGQEKLPETSDPSDGGSR